MKTLDSKILLEFQSLPEELKKQVLAYIKSLRQVSSKNKGGNEPNKNQLDEPQVGYGGAKKQIMLKAGWDDKLTDLFDL